MVKFAMIEQHTVFGSTACIALVLTTLFCALNASWVVVREGVFDLSVATGARVA
jgi:hypothetical protein